MSIIPIPVHLSTSEGFFILQPETVIIAEGEVGASGQQLAGLLAPATGYQLKVNPSSSATSKIEIRFDPQLTLPGKEGYRLTVTPSSISILASGPAGAFYAVQTLLQLLPPDIFREACVDDVEWVIPCLQIEDYPRFGWRGLMLDTGRYFMPKEFIKKLIDLLALHKMNVFHWHLTEDQGWRVEIKKYPRLTEVGGWRKETLVGHLDITRLRPRYDKRPHGGFYSQEDVREIVAYARQRFVTIIPEIEMPGHSQAAIAAYPELGNLAAPLEVSRTWGIHENVFNVNENTILFLQDVLAEVLDLFPSQFIHIGGDEVPKKQWRESPAAQARLRELGLHNEDELQSYFIRRMDAFLTSHGRRLIGWDEILEGGLASNATVMSWRGEAGGIAAARAGHDVVMSPDHYTYFDYYQSWKIRKEPLAIGGLLPLKKVYNYEPVPHGLSPEEAPHVLGAQGQVWTEYIPTPKQAEYMIFPRACALAEVLWTPAALKNYASFTNRLEKHYQRLKVLDVNFRPGA
ncbi:MAG: beta-N-acetylhexosaminidase [Anaerolineaceae bacterium]